MNGKKTIFITGATGFIGAHLVRELSLRDYHIRALVRSERESTSRIHYVTGDLFDPASLDRAIAGCDAVIHLVGIIREKPGHGQTFERIHHQAAANVIDAAKRNSIPRFIHMSALGAAADSPSEYSRTKFQAEQYLKSSSLDYTIFRPSLVIGPGGEFTEMIERWVHFQKVPWFFIPYFGHGLFGQRSSMIQPIQVTDVSRAFADALENPETIGKTIDLAGPEPMDWPKLYQHAAIAYRGTKRASIGIPIWYARLLTILLPSFLLPFNRAQVEMAAQDNVTDLSITENILGWKPQPIQF